MKRSTVTTFQALRGGSNDTRPAGLVEGIVQAVENTDASACGAEQDAPVPADSAKLGGEPAVQMSPSMSTKRRASGLQLTFFGAAGEVTGSCTLIEAGDTTLLVDCGLHQGGHETGQIDRFTFQPWQVQAVILTHAHLDHAGLLPWLCRSGFTGPVFATPGTRDVCQVLLTDSAKLQEEDAAYAERRGAKPHPPLYTRADVPEAMSRIVAVEYTWPFEVAPGVSAEFYEAGHILGAASVRLTFRRHEVIFSGDIGARGRPIVRDPQPPPHAHTVITEATYGDRLHPPISSSVDALAEAIRDIVERGGVAMVPVFAVGRTETILYELGALMRAGRIPPIPVYLDSPLALEAVAVLRRHLDYYDEEARALLSQGIDPLAFPSLHLVRTPEESRQLNDLAGPAIVLAGSGMCTGGRIRHHLRNRLPNPRDMVIFVGYQAAGTLGRILVEGAHEVKLYGEWVPVRAEVRSIEGFSAHADQNGLLAWLKAIEGVERVIINHAEPAAAAAYVETVAAAGLPRPTVASLGEVVEL